jgi:hypothetical protein
MAIFGGDSGAAGMEPLNDFWLFSSPAQRWEEITNDDAAWPPGRWGHSAAAVQSGQYTELLVVFGGIGNAAALLSDTWQFSFHTMAWTLISVTASASQPTARYLHTTVQLGSRMFMYLVRSTHLRFRF